MHPGWRKTIMDYSQLILGSLPSAHSLTAELDCWQMKWDAKDCDPPNSVTCTLRETSPVMYTPTSTQCLNYARHSPCNIVRMCTFIQHDQAAENPYPLYNGTGTFKWIGTDEHSSRHSYRSRRHRRQFRTFPSKTNGTSKHYE